MKRLDFVFYFYYFFSISTKKNDLLSPKSVRCSVFHIDFDFRNRNIKTKPNIDLSFDR